MPSLKGQRRQLTTAESNDSRLAIKVRWVVETIHGILGEKFHLLHQQVDNELLSRIHLYRSIASFLNNEFGKHLTTERGVDNGILA